MSRQIILIYFIVTTLTQFGCRTESVNKGIAVNNSKSVDCTLFIADVDNVPWIIASFCNTGEGIETIDLADLYEPLKYEVISKRTKEELPMVSNFMASPTDHPITLSLTLSPNESIFILCAIPPFDYTSSKLTSKILLHEYTFTHEDYGKVEEF